MKLLSKISNLSRAVLLHTDEVRFRREYYKESILSYPPRHVTIGITSSCNNKCVFCAYHSDDARDGASNVYGLGYNLSFDAYKKMVDMCHSARVPRVHISATGEPFFHKEILEMIDYTARTYGFVSLQTNFYKPLFDRYSYLDEIIKRKHSIKYVTTDILSGDPETHESLKKGSSYSDVLTSMEYINKYSNIEFEIHYIITKFNYLYIGSLIDDLYRRHINCRIAIVNLHPHQFNKFTAPDALYKSQDEEIRMAIQGAKDAGKQRGIPVSIPMPADTGRRLCGSFWARFQVWPVQGIDQERYAENVVVGGCNAVVRGRMKSLGYFFDYDSIMELWNNEHFTRIREGLIMGMYPDEECLLCQNYAKGY